MGICLPCLNSSSADYDQPTPETRRRQQAEAAERRQQEMDGRGVKDPEALKRKQRKKAELEKKADTQPNSGDGLRWQVS
ncbi:hypothetical protein V1264_015871 [Littorina saxatilis]|uniref:Small VCP/p97-interacting protein n=1 Tax=Littorina saxatilis TaxID=31220 RepID=A0AAN9BQX9_9CAEN